MLRACIDIGSNTTRLLVADCDAGELVECRQERAFTMIGRSIGQDGEIPAAKLAEVLEAVAAQHAVARELGAQHVRCVATAGVRRATNGAVLARLVSEACDGLELEILSGAEEARLAFIGAVWGLGASAESGIGVVDAGGGSCELVVGDAPGTVRWWVSLPIGSSDVAELLAPGDPPTEAALQAADHRVRELFSQVSPPDGVGRLVAVGGSATSLRLLAGPVLDAEGFERLLDLARITSSQGLSRRFGIDRDRARLLAGGLLILRAVSAVFSSPLEVGRGGLREGLLLDQQ